MYMAYFKNGKGAKRPAQWTVGLLLAFAMVGVVLLDYRGCERAKVREQFADIDDDRLKKETALVSDLTNEVISLDAFRH